MKKLYNLILAGLLILFGCQAQAQKPELPFNVLINETGDEMEIEWNSCLENSRLFILGGNEQILDSKNLCESNNVLNFKSMEPGIYTLRIEHYTGVGECRILKSFDNNMSNIELLQNKPKLAFDIFPNPAQNLIDIASETCLENSILSIQDIHGRTVRNLQLCKNGYNVDVSDLPKGLYFIRIEHYTGVGVKRLVKE